MFIHIFTIYIVSTPMLQLIVSSKQDIVKSHANKQRVYESTSAS